MPLTFSAYSMFSAAVRDGKRLNCWNTKPIDVRRNAGSRSGRAGIYLASLDFESARWE